MKKAKSERKLMPTLSSSPRMRSAPHSRLSLAISWIRATVSWEILGLREAARDLYFQKSSDPGDASASLAFSATSSDLLLERSISVPSRSEVVSGVVQATKHWWSD